MKAKTISERENYLRAIEFKNPEWIPMTLEFTSAVWDRHGKDLATLLQEHPLVTGNHHRGYHPFHDTDPICVQGMTYRDDWGCVWHNAQGGIIGRVIEHPLQDWSAFRNYLPPDPHKQYNWAALKRKTEDDREKGFLTTALPESFAQGGFFDRMIMLRGFENLLMDFLDQPPQLPDLIAMLLDYNIRYLQKWLEIGVDIIWHHGDIGSQNRLLFSPGIFRRYLKPAYKTLFKIAREAGTHVWYSSDGHVLDVVDDLLECGVSLHDPQVRANTINGIRDYYKNKLCALVDIDEQMLPFCSPQDIDNQISEVVQKIADPRGGLMIFAIPSHDVPLRNIEAILVAWERHCFFDWP